MDLFIYIFLSVVYLMFIHFAIAIKNQFNIFLMSGIFIFAGAIGYFLKSYETGFVAGIILSLVFW